MGDVGLPKADPNDVPNENDAALPSEPLPLFLLASLKPEKPLRPVEDAEPKLKLIPLAPVPPPKEKLGVVFDASSLDDLTEGVIPDPEPKLLVEAGAPKLNPPD